MDDDKTKPVTGSSDTVQDMALAREIRDLPLEMLPSRNLWVGIERRIAEHPQPRTSRHKRDWMPYGVAASLLVACAALVLNLVQPQPVQEQLAGGSAGPGAGLSTGHSTGHALETMQVEYLKVRNPLVDQFTEVNKNLAPETLEELYRNIEIMERARKDIEARVLAEPDNRRLVEQLMRIHEQELELLKQDFSSPTRFM